MAIIKINTDKIQDWDTFHDVFKEALGFPDFYGRNMDAWIDCMTCIDDPSSGMTNVHIKLGEVLTIDLGAIKDFATRCPEQYKALIECSSFVNYRRIDIGDHAVLALSFC